MYAADNQGDELDHIYVLTPEGESIDLTPGDGLKAMFLGWSQGNDFFYIATNERDSAVFDVYGYAAQGYERELLFENDANWQLGAISPNGRYLALLRQNSSADNDIFVLDRHSDDPLPRHITPMRATSAMPCMNSRRTTKRCSTALTKAEIHGRVALGR